MKFSKCLLSALLSTLLSLLVSSLVSSLAVASANSPAPVLTPEAQEANFVRELRTDPSFANENAADRERLQSDLQLKLKDGDPRVTAALAAIPAYFAYQDELAKQAAVPLTDEQAIQLYNLKRPILTAALPANLGPLSELQALSLNLYTGITYQAIDRDLFINQRHPERYTMPTVIALVDSALDLLPDVVSTVQHVQELAPKEFSELIVGSTIKFATYMSTSTEKIGWAGNTRMIIHCKTGKDISIYSVNPQEHEVVIRRGKKIKQLTAPILQEGKYVVEFDEL